MRTLLILFHSQTGGTMAMAHACAQAAREHAGDTVRVRVLKATEANAGHMLSADAVVFATPEYLAAISGAMKTFFDVHYYSLLGNCVGMPYAAMVCAGSDGQNALAQIDRIATGLRLKQIAPPVLVCTHAQKPEAILATKRLEHPQLVPCRELGATLGAALAIGIY